MAVLLRLARWLKGSECQKLVRHTANEITVNGAGFGIGEFKIDLGSLSTKIKEFHRITQTTVALDNSQYLLCDQISRLDNEQLKEDCIRIRLQLIMGFSQLHVVLGSIDEQPVEKLNDELARWVRYMSKLHQKSIDIIGPQKKSPSPKDRSELEQIMSYQGVEENEMQEAMKIIK